MYNFWHSQNAILTNLSPAWHFDATVLPEGEVSSISNLGSVNGLTAVQATQANRPIVVANGINGRKAMLMGSSSLATNSRRLQISPKPNKMPNYTVVSVISPRQDSTLSGTQLFYGSISTAGASATAWASLRDSVYGQDGTSNIRNLANHFGNNTHTSYGRTQRYVLVNNLPFVCVQRYTSGASVEEFWINGQSFAYTSVLSAATSVGGTSEEYFLGAWSASTLNGIAPFMIGEFQMYSSALTDSQIQMLSLGLMNKWGVGFRRGIGVGTNVRPTSNTFVHDGDTYTFFSRNATDTAALATSGDATYGAYAPFRWQQSFWYNSVAATAAVIRMDISSPKVYKTCVVQASPGYLTAAFRDFHVEGFNIATSQWVTFASITDKVWTADDDMMIIPINDSNLQCSSYRLRCTLNRGATNIIMSGIGFWE